MNSHIRPLCILCENSKLVSFSKNEYPVYECVAIDTINPSWDIEYGYCENCYSVQLMQLGDPAVIYDKNYFQPLHHTYLWIQHNISFIKFIIYNLNSDIHNSIIEIGSSSFCLGKHLIHYYTDYTVFDYSIEQANQQTNVKYIEGNCENYDFIENSNIVMSHVFEHLYEPKKFIQNCSRNRVKNIFIAIPSMDNTQQLHIGQQHTFMYNQNDIEYIFGQYNYKLNDILEWDSVDNAFPCIFFHFTLYDNPITIERQINTERHLYTIDRFTQRITIPKNTFLSTCSMYGLIAYSCIKNKEDIIGVIDYSPQKRGKKFGTTNLIVYPYEHLKNYNENTHIFISHPKKNNIIAIVKNANPDIKIII
jgi:hypothetical protein